MRNLPYLVVLIALSTVEFAACDNGSVEPLLARGPDTTSHNFTWQVTTLGDGNSSVLSDVIFINDTLAYAVGEIYLRDSLGNWDPLPYNLAIWNGQQWGLRRVSVLYRGNMITPPLNAIFAFSATDIWLSSGVPIHGDSQNWTQYHLFDMGVLTQNDGSIKKIWGRNSSELWFVGNRGTIVRYSNGTWQKLESGTTLDVRDVYGNRNPRTGKDEILAVASSTGSFERRILLISSTVSVVADSGLLPFSKLGGVWLMPGSIYFVVGDGVYSRHDLSSNSPWTHYAGVTQYYTPSVRGNGLNDVIATGVFGELLHFNGVSWYSYRTSLGVPIAGLASVAFKGNPAIVVGFDGSRALAIVGRR